VSKKLDDLHHDVHVTAIQEKISITTGITKNKKIRIFIGMFKI